MPCALVKLVTLPRGPIWQAIAAPAYRELGEVGQAAQKGPKALMLHSSGLNTAQTDRDQGDVTCSCCRRYVEHANCRSHVLLVLDSGAMPCMINMATYSTLRDACMAELLSTCGFA
jgi:hypothetical protein